MQSNLFCLLPMIHEKMAVVRESRVEGGFGEVFASTRSEGSDLRITHTHTHTHTYARRICVLASSSGRVAVKVGRVVSGHVLRCGRDRAPWRYGVHVLVGAVGPKAGAVGRDGGRHIPLSDAGYGTHASLLGGAIDVGVLGAGGELGRRRRRRVRSPVDGGLLRQEVGERGGHAG